MRNIGVLRIEKVQQKWYDRPMKKMPIKEDNVTIPRAEYELMKSQIQYLMEQLKLSKHREFGASSEKSEYDQLNLFNEAEVYAESLAVEPALTEVEKHYRKKRREAKDRLPEDLPVEVIEHRLPDNEQDCPACDGVLHVMGKEVVRRDLKLIPATAVIVEHIQYTYACRSCEKNAISVPIVKATMPNAVIKSSFAAPESVAHLMTQKFVMGVPLYRQEQEWKRQGIMLNRQTMSNWLIRCAEEWLVPVYDELKKKLLTHQVLHADETTLQVLREPGRTAQTKSYMWVYRTSGDAKHPIVLLEYQPGRGTQYPKAYLDGWSGYLHTDGWDAYHKLPGGIVIVGCWAHARRKFDAALKVLGLKAKEGSGPFIGKRYCDKLFAIERDLAALSADERYQKRLELAKPVMDDFWSWMHSLGNLADNAFGKAVSYTLNQWKYLEHYLLDGRLEISNNRAERSVKPFVIDRKNFLFAITPAGATASAIIFSICETAKENGLSPYEYLNFLFRALPNNHGRPIDEFLPGGCLVPKSCLPG
jgi:transposase